MGYTLVKTVGIEIEFSKSGRDDITRRFEDRYNRNWRIVHDGSCTERYYTYQRGGERVIPQGPIGRHYGIQRRYFGGELVSPTIDTTRIGWFDDIKDILAELEELEKGIINKNTSIHVHVNVNGRDLPIRYFHNIVRLSRFVEDSLYRLSCADMGRHRGESNDYLYARPNSTPPCVYISGTEARVCPAFSMDKLLKTENLEDVRKALSRLDKYDSTKYVPSRYVGINYVSLFTLGSIEFRTFNSTFNPDFVKAWVELSRHLVELAFNDLMYDFSSLESHPIGEGELQLGEFVEQLFIPEDLALQLETLWSVGQYCKRPKPIMTHVNRRVIDWYGASKFRPEDVELEDIEEHEQPRYEDETAVEPDVSWGAVQQLL